MSSAKKKLVIKPFREKPKLPANYEDDTWSKLQLAIDAIFAQRTVATGYEELYQAVDNLCLHKLGARLHGRLFDELDKHSGSLVASLAQLGPSPDAFLAFVARAWAEFEQAIATVRAVFLVLDRTHVASTPGARNVLELSLESLRKHFLLENTRVLGRLSEGLLAQVHRDRQGETVDGPMLRSLLRCLDATSLYEPHFQVPLLEASQGFFGAEGARMVGGAGVGASGGGGGGSGAMSSSSSSSVGGGSSSGAVEESGRRAAQFLSHVERRIAQVSQQCESYLAPSSKRPLLHCVDQTLFAPYLPLLLDPIGGGGGGFDALLHQDKRRDLKRLLELASRLGTDSVSMVRQAWARHARVEGSLLACDEARDKDLVSLMLAFKDKLDLILRDSFGWGGHLEAFKTALKDSLEVAANSRTTNKTQQQGKSIPELMAIYCDGVLRGEKGVGEDEATGKLTALMALFRLVAAKDVFEAFYKASLAKRLLSNKSQSFDLELVMLSKLKAECGSQFTAKLDGMLKDLALSDATAQHYRNHCAAATASGATNSATTTSAGLPSGSAMVPAQSHDSSSSSSGRDTEGGGGGGSDGLELNIKVLTVGFWPANRPIEHVQLPSPLLAAQKHFESFYAQHYQGRRLAWVHPLSSCVLRAQLNPSSSSSSGRKELDCPFFMALCLLAFNGPSNATLPESSSAQKEEGSSSSSAATPGLPTVRRSLNEMRSIVGLSDEGELFRALQALSSGKVRLLVKESPNSASSSIAAASSGKSSEVCEGDVFYLDTKFKHKLFRVKLSALQLKADPAAQAAVLESVDRDRAYALDACIVRTMKARKTLSHAALVAEVIGQLKFPAAGADVKRRIESLLEREYLERDDDKPNTYNYLA